MLRKALRLSAVLFGLSFSGSVTAQSLITTVAKSDVKTTVAALETRIKQAGATLFATIDHAHGAKLAGTELPPTTLLIFGNPKMGAPVMAADRRAALHLPLHVLVWRDGDVTRVGYEDPAALKERYTIKGVDPIFVTMGQVLGKLTSDL